MGVTKKLHQAFFLKSQVVVNGIQLLRDENYFEIFVLFKYIAKQ